MKRSREPGEEIGYGFDNEDVERVASRDSSLPAAKALLFDSDVEDGTSDRGTMKCSLPPHREPIAFRSYQEYESHYTMLHTNRCLECRKNFPSEHLLGVHIEESHDPLVRVKRDKGEHTYSCFVEGCERKCLTHQKRRLHLIDKHMYPRNFYFGVTKDGIDGRRSLLVEGTHQRRTSSTASVSKESRRRASAVEGKEVASKGKDDVSGRYSSDTKAEVKQVKQRDDAEMADLAGAMSALQFVPASVRFGRGRAGFSKS
ncbi:hypothetical protein C2857_006198 [Epichloe festucae Fl1]|uniref:C2H2-type domain-containing protein n=1 Tax=Epichloe festucae (strain Fl1) TaxID=877507 RepID=A0A7S9KTD5_EPIFF|nr:hypothetical protein C2857_006198 [Epichloe festucae Fl1]